MSKKVKAEKPKKERTEADTILGNQIIKSATAVVCAAALSFGITSSAGKLSEAKIKVAELSPASSAQSGTASASDSGYTGGDTDTSGTTDFSQDTSSDISDASADTTADTPSDSTPADSGSSDSTPAQDSKTETPAQKTGSGAFQSNAEIIAYCNKALNDAKQAKVGFTKTFVRKGGDNLPSIVSSLIKQNKVTKFNKGDDSIVDEFPAGGFTWSCKLRESDVQKVEFKQNGQYYEITLRLGNEKNPGKGETSAYGRAMTVITEADAKDMLSAVKSATLNYHDGYVYAKIDSKTGKLVKAEFSASADLQGELALIGSLSATNICSTETFTDIVW